MEFWAALAGAVVGAGAGGLVTWLVSARQWRRERRETAMETFMVMATEKTNSYVVSDVSMGRTSKASRADLEQALVLLELYAPAQVATAAVAFVTADYLNESDWVNSGHGRGVDELEFMDAAFTRLDIALQVYRNAVRAALGLKLSTQGRGQLAPRDPE